MGEGLNPAHAKVDRLHLGRIDRRELLKWVAMAGGASLMPPVIDSLAGPLPSAWAAPTTKVKGGGGSNCHPGPVGSVQSTLVSPPAGQASQLGYPLGLHVVPGGPVLVADFGSEDGGANGRILSVDPETGAVTPLFSSDGYWPSDVAADTSGNIFFTDYGWDDDDAGSSNSYATGPSEDGRIVVIPAGSTAATTLATPLVDPSYLLVDEDNGVLYVSDTGEANGSGGANPSGRVLAYPLYLGTEISLGTPRTVAGTGNPITNGQPLPAQPVWNEPATSINIFVAFGLALFGRSLYVSDEYAHVVYRVDLRKGLISTYVGNGTASGVSGDGGPAISAVVPYPQGLTIDCLGNLYILELSGDIRRVDVKSKVITTVSSVPPPTDNVGIKYDSGDGSLWVVYNDVPGRGPGASGLYRVA